MRDYSRMESITDLFMASLFVSLICAAILAGLTSIMYVVAAMQTGYPLFWDTWFGA